ncbi:MAG TPA: pilus assembly protein TadG-related protein [Candidatus Dormibacteraeota bacterium]|nr:pilus assembly protein TadG-related protein [Candidatus Dormibacteraeota bacterium]
MRRATLRNQDGQAVVIVAAIIIALVIFGAVVFDLGLAMTDRRNLQAYADAAAVAGARSYTSTDVNHAHWVAMQYLTGPLGFSLPTGSCTSSSVCPAGTYTVTPYSVQLGDNTLPGWTYPSALDVVITHQQPSIFSRMMGFNQLTIAASARGGKPGPVLTGAGYSLAAVSGDAAINGGGAGTQTATGPVYAFGNFGANNGPHSTGVPGVQTNYDGTACPGSPTNEVDFGGGSSNGLSWHVEAPGAGTIGLNKPSPTPFDNSGPTSSGPTYTTTGAAKDGSGHWKPGIYNGIYPSGGLMNAGVYKIINVTSAISFGSITNVTHTASGTEDTTGAVALVLDSTDTGGSLDWSAAVINGLGDLHAANYSGTRDPLGTHNFAIYGGNGASGYAGAIDIGPHASTDLSGIIYLPKVTYSQHGNTSPLYTGSATFASMSSAGTGNVKFSWVCGLSAVAAVGSGGGLIR